MEEAKIEVEAPVKAKVDAVHRVLERVADDARDEAELYIEETEVPAGGE